MFDLVLRNPSTLAGAGRVRVRDDDGLQEITANLVCARTGSGPWMTEDRKR
jgi:hypothetical protein